MSKPIPIVVNRMFTGDKYLNDNIGHEIINLFAADNSLGNFIYFCDKGTYNHSQFSLPKYSIQVRPAGKKLVEVINIAEIEKFAQEYINDISYGGASLKAIFEGNTDFIGKNKQKLNTFVTFKAKRVIKPLTPKYIAYGGHISQISDCIQCQFNVNEKLRNYIKPGDSDHHLLEQFAQDAFLDSQGWIEVNHTIEHISNDKAKEPRPTPGDIYGISNLELPYSNAFKFFIQKYPELLSGLCNHLHTKSGCKELDSICKYFSTHPNHQLKDVVREWENIDLLIEVDNQWVIVIENKIFSDLNGKKVNEEITQLDKYYKTITNTYKEWQKIFVLLLPDHNDIDISNCEDWHKLHYSSVSEYLNKFKEGHNDPNLDDFALMVERHSDKDYNYSVMRRRFERAIARATASKEEK